MPVSTTHVTCDSLFGIGIVSRHAHWHTIGGIGAAWLITLPLGMLLGGVLTVWASSLPADAFLLSHEIACYLRASRRPLTSHREFSVSVNPDTDRLPTGVQDCGCEDRVYARAAIL